MSEESTKQVPNDSGTSDSGTSDSGTSDSGTSDVKTGEWLKSGLDLYKSNFVLLFVSGLVTILIAIFSVGILAGPMIVGYYLLVLRLVDKSEPAPAIGDVFKGFSFFVQSLLFVVTWALINLAVSTLLDSVPGVGFLLSTVASIAIGAAVMFGLPLIADKGLDFIPASKASYARVSQNFLGFAVFSAVAGIVGFSGAILLGFGVFLTFPIFICAVAHAYRDSF